MARTAREALTQRELALRLEISTSWVRELTARGTLTRDADGLYPWPNNEQRWARYQAERVQPTEGGPADAYEVARTRKTEADAQLRELELAIRRGELMPVDQVLDKVRAPLEAVDAQLRTVPRRHSDTWARRLSITQAQAIALLHDLVEDVRADLRSVFADDGAAKVA